MVCWIDYSFINLIPILNITPRCNRFRYILSAISALPTRRIVEKKKNISSLTYGNQKQNVDYQQIHEKSQWLK